MKLRLTAAITLGAVALLALHSLAVFAGDPDPLPGPGQSVNGPPPPPPPGPPAPPPEGSPTTPLEQDPTPVSPLQLASPTPSPAPVTVGSTSSNDPAPPQSAADGTKTGVDGASGAVSALPSAGAGPDARDNSTVLAIAVMAMLGSTLVLAATLRRQKAG